MASNKVVMEDSVVKIKQQTKVFNQASNSYKLGKATENLLLNKRSRLICKNKKQACLSLAKRLGRAGVTTCLDFCGTVKTFITEQVHLPTRSELQIAALILFAYSAGIGTGMLYMTYGNHGREPTFQHDTPSALANDFSVCNLTQT